jgi:alpha-tubulin suppressor-like RCC1 family protein
MLKQFILVAAAFLLVGCEPPHPCDIGATPLSCEMIENIPEPYMAFNNTSNPTSSVAERGTSTFTFNLLYKVPDGNVVVDLSTNDATEATLSPTQLTYTPANWGTRQTVTITGPVDNITDGNQSSTITASINTANTNDDYYDAVTNKTMSLTTTDVDVDGMVLSSILGTVSETGSTATFTVALTASPDCAGNVVINLTDNDTDNSEISYTPTQLTFTSADWYTAQTVTVTGLNDNLSDGNITSLITLAVNDGSTCDPDYDALSDSYYTATNTDDDTAGFTVSESGGSSSTSETGTTDTFTVVLTSEPTSNVVLNISSDDTGEVARSPTSLTFTSGNWNTAQTVTLTGQDDYIADGTQSSTISVSVDSFFTADADYGALSSQTFSATNTDDDVVGITISHAGANSSSTSVSETGTTDNVTVVLNTLPSGNVVLDISSADTGEFTVGTSQLTFTTGNWNAPQTVVLTGVADSSIDGNQTVQFRAAPNGATADADYSALSTVTFNVTVVNIDFAPGIDSGRIMGSGSLTEGSGSTRTQYITLDWQPASNVVIEFYSTGGGGDEVSFSPDNMTFTNGNWNVRQNLTIAAVADNIVDDNNYVDVRARAIASVTDDAWDSLDDSVVNLWADNNDDVTYTITETGGSTSVNESGTTDTLTLVVTIELDSAIGNVNFRTVSQDLTEFTATPTGSMVFNSTNWNVAQTITVTGINDNDADGDITANLRTYSYSNSPLTVSPSQTFTSVTTVDNDTPTYTNLTGSYYHYCMIRTTDGTVWCWGRNDDGQLGDGTTTSRHSPVQAGSLTGVVSIGLEETSTCALDNVSELHCWGKIFEGDGSTRTTYTSPQAMSGGSAPFGNIPAGTTIFGNSNQDLYTFNGSSVRVVGNNSNRAAVDPSWGITPTKFYVPEGGSNRNAACFLDNSSSKKLYCMGDGAEGLYHTTDSSNRLTPVEMTHVDGRYDFTLGSKNFFYITEGSQELWCWGNQSAAGSGIGVCGTSDTTNYITSSRQIDLGQNRAKDIIASKDHACILYDASDGSTIGKVGCTGSGADGKLGMGNTSNRSQFPINNEILTNMQEIALTLNSTCAIDRYSKVYCVGDNTYGELGNAGQLGGADRVTPDSGWTIP